MNSFERHVEALTGQEGIYASGLEILQVNLGLLCNQQCAHCHLEASPRRTELMEWGAMEQIIGIASDLRLQLIDITGGAPELNPNFRRFVETLRHLGLKVQVRTNLTVLVEPNMDTVPEWLREQGVDLVASLPCYLEENICAQRGKDVYGKSIEAVRRLNEVGYGSGSEPSLSLVYNPGGPFLPPRQEDLEAEYRRELESRFGLRFSSLLTITNMPIGRFWTTLVQQKEADEYLRLLRESFNPRTLEKLMCKHQVSVGWDGRLYDCDFNLALGLETEENAPSNLSEFDESVLGRRKIVTADHCFGCAAGCGSSCSGVLV